MNINEERSLSMFIKQTGKDYTKKEINNYLMPHYNLIINYM